MGIRYALALTSAAQTLASQGAIAAQRELWINPTKSIFAPVAELRQDVYDTTGDGDEGTIFQSFGYAYPAGAVGTHMVVVMDTACESLDGNPVVTFNVTVAGGGSDTATATFVRPSQAASAVKVFGKGVAVDLLPVTDATKKITAIVSLAGISYGEVGTKFRVLAVTPYNSADWVEVKRVRSFNTSLPSPMPVDIAHNFDSALDTVQGREEVPMLSGNMVLAGTYDDMRNYNGTTVAIMEKRVVDGRYLVSTEVYGGIVIMVKKETGDGNSECTVSFDGKHREYASFIN